LDVSGQLYAPAALPSGKEPPVPIGYEVGWVPRAGLGDVEKKKFFTLLGLERDLLVVQPVANHYTDYVMPAPII
jgi:hypothetical protein